MRSYSPSALGRQRGTGDIITEEVSHPSGPIIVGSRVVKSDRSPGALMVDALAESTDHRPTRALPFDLEAAVRFSFQDLENLAELCFL